MARRTALGLMSVGVLAAAVAARAAGPASQPGAPPRPAAPVVHLPPKQQTAKNVEDLTKLIGLYWLDKNGEYPADLPAAFDEVGIFSAADAKRMMSNPRTGASPGYKYVRPGANRDAVANPTTVPMIYEIKDGKPDPDGVIAYADGHVAPAKR